MFNTWMNFSATISRGGFISTALFVGRTLVMLPNSVAAHCVIEDAPESAAVFGKAASESGIFGIISRCKGDTEMMSI